MIRLQRLSSDPILRPDPAHCWEAGAVFNPAAMLHNDLVHLIYRATDTSSRGSEARYINSLGYAISEDGLHFKRMCEPILTNDTPQEARGPEDPRVVRLDGRFYMMYTGYGGRFDGDYRICLASSTNLITWQRHGVVLDEPNKDASLFPEKINGRYLMFHRRPPDIWLASSPDLKTWSDHRLLASPIEANEWESVKIGIGGPPIRTAWGWLLIYHGVGPGPRYSLGAMLLDLDDPGRVIARQLVPILEPKLDWEVHGHVPNVVFSCGQVVMGDDLYVYYAGADTVIGVAVMRISDIPSMF